MEGDGGGGIKRWWGKRVGREEGKSVMRMSERGSFREEKKLETL